MSLIQIYGVFALLGVLCPLVLSIDCNKDSPRVDPQTCCKMPDLVTKELAEKCKAHIPSTESSSSTSEESKHHNKHAAACYVTCIFNETGIVNEPGSKINEAKLSEYLKTVLANDEEWIPIVETSFKTCNKKIEDMRNKYKEMKEKKGTSSPAVEHPPHRPHCSWHAQHLMGCVFIENFINCPANKWTDSKECNEKREHMKNCKPPMKNDKFKNPNSEEKN